jgi:hypothetical protein
MDFRRPLTLITPTLDGDVLTTLAVADVEFTGRELARRARHGSTEGIRRAADRLVGEGIVIRRSVGGAHLYRLNRQHIAAPWIEAIATLPEQLIDRLRSMIDEWNEPAGMAFLFGSVARDEASSSSDLDLLVVRRDECDADSDAWRSQLVALQQATTALTGNDARVLEIGEVELGGDRMKGVLADVSREGIPLLGSKHELQRLLQRTQQDEPLQRA